VSTALNRVEAIFWEAARLAPGPERDAYLAQACGEDRELRRRVERLVSVQPRLDRFLERPFAGPAPALHLADAGDRPGTVIGAYKLLEQIGEGGMGAVWMAEQTRPVRRRVALKIVKPGLDTAQVVARFEAERQALALMDHPHIARVLDAGATAAGRPYFVMELVRGLPITDYCDEATLGVRDRLALFVQVCRAVQHAHQKGVIHRDLKPSNVLVTVIDGRPVPKVIDFGVAKATAGTLTDRTLFTGFHQLVGTPLYMSPEQAELSGVDVDTRTDVYALGVLLYELLTGTTPFDPAALRRAAFDEVRRIIREEEPARPSRRLSTLAAERQTTVSEQRGMDGRRLDRLLRGELDWVVMRALEKDRNRRYESAGALAADVERYLADEPVAAGPPSAWYRARKYARRHRRLLVTAGIVAAALIGATAVSTWQAVEATAARRLADRRAENERQARQEAAQEATVSSAVNDFLQMDLLRLADRQVQSEEGLVADPNLTVRQALHRAAAKIGQRFQDQPMVEAAIRATIGEAYMGVGDDRLGVAHLSRSLELYEANRPPDHPQVLQTIDRLADAYASLYRWPEAAALRERAVNVVTASLGPDHPDTLESLNKLGELYVGAGRYREGLPLLKRGMARRRASLGPDHPLTQKATHALAQAYRRAGQWEKSMSLAEPLLQKAKTTLGLAHETTMDLMSLVAMDYQNVGRLDEALALHEAVLEMTRNRYGREDDQTIHSLFSLSRAYWAAGKLDKAEPLLHEAVRVARTFEGIRGSITESSSVNAPLPA
jgi:eukaryotic-like serine/threonine-protein kinase